jgi:hypothetical protein
MLDIFLSYTSPKGLLYDAKEARAWCVFEQSWIGKGGAPAPQWLWKHWRSQKKKKGGDTRRASQCTNVYYEYEAIVCSSTGWAALDTSRWKLNEMYIIHIIIVRLNLKIMSHAANMPVPCPSRSI